MRKRNVKKSAKRNLKSRGKMTKLRVKETVMLQAQEQALGDQSEPWWIAAKLNFCSFAVTKELKVSPEELVGDTP
jgi:hypothetical protein